MFSSVSPVVSVNTYSKGNGQNNTNHKLTKSSSYSINDILNIISYPRQLSSDLSNITVAIIDSGFNKSIIPNYWINTKEIPNNSIDDDHNGFIDDYYGWDFVTNKPVTYSGDFSSHGTFISNIISSMTKNSTTIKLMDIRVLNSNNENKNYDSFVKAFEYALLFPNIKVIQFSIEFIKPFLGSYPQKLHWIFTKAYLRHIAIVSVSGNGEKDQISDPGNWSETLAVTSIDQIAGKWIKSVYANNGSNIDVSAPGTDIKGKGVTGNSLILSGTSFSSAFVGGAISLLESMYASRNMSVETIRSLLQSSSVKLNNCNQFGSGLLNVTNLLNLASSTSYLDYKPVCSPTYTIPTSLEKLSSSANLSFSNFIFFPLIGIVFRKKYLVRKLKRTSVSENIVT